MMGGDLMSDISKIVGDRIRILRSEKGLSQEDLAGKAGIDSSHLGRLERGERNPSLISLDKILKALGVTFEDLFKYIQPTNTETDSTTMSLIINKLNTLSLEDQKLILNLIDTTFQLMKHKA
jgi:transcriptional regulator with XRE-family HTH domain